MSAEEPGGHLTGEQVASAMDKLWHKDWQAALGARGAYLGTDAALDDPAESCAWCQRSNELLSFEGRLFCDEDCANAYWWEWGYDA